MISENNSDVTPVIEAQESNENQTIETPVQQTTDTSAQDQDRNWAEARSVMREQSEKIRDLEAQITKKQEPVTEGTGNEWENLADDDIVTKKQAASHSKKVVQEAIKDAFKQYQASTCEDRLGTRYPDFKQICSNKNIEILKQKFPDLARSVANNPDPDSQGKAAYDLIKNLGIHSPELKENERKLQENKSRPNLGASAGSKTGALNHAHLFEGGGMPEMTNSLKEALQKEMAEAAKGV